MEAEALMRARFSAYVKKDADFLVSHPDIAQRTRIPEALTTCSGTASHARRMHCSLVRCSVETCICASRPMKALHLYAGKHHAS